MNLKICISLFFFVFTQCCISQKQIENIEFKNLKINKASFLKQIILSKIGNVLDSVKLEKDIVLLNRLNGVSKATYNVLKSYDDNVIISYDIVENFSLIPAFNLWTTNKGAAIRLGLYDYNFLGRNITFGGFYQYNNFNSYGANFAAPNIIKGKYGFEINTQKISTSEPLFFKNKKATYQYTNNSLEILGVYQLNYKNKFKFGATLFSESYKYQNGDTDVNVPLNLVLDKKLFKFQYVFDDLDYNFYLVNGFKINFFGQYVTTTNNYQNKFIIAWTDFSYFKTTVNKGNFATRLRIGLASNTQSPFAPFSVDNNLNIRGVGNIIDRGTGTFVLNTEFRKTLYEKNWFVLQGNAFVDLGSWRQPGGELSDFLNNNNFRVYPGLGIRLIHKTIYNAVLRIDYGYGVSKNGSKGLVFGIGQYF